MKLYEIDNAILDCIDLETGEVIDTERLDALNMERSKRIAQELSAICKYCGIDGFDLK